MRSLSKSFGSNKVLREVDLDLYAGEVHLLAGENGAGKSTLIKILAGAISDYEGLIEWSQAGSVAVIYQELSLVPSLSVAENLLLGRLPQTRGFVQWAEMAAVAVEALGRVSLDLDPGQLVGDLPIGIQQRIEIAKALLQNAEVIVMDEPTSALNAQEVESLFELVAKLKADGRAIVYITHKMEEISRVADVITVLRDGQAILTKPASEWGPGELVATMVGRDIGDYFPERSAPALQEGLRFHYDDQEIEVRSGEVVGIGGLQGSGASQLLEAIFHGKVQQLTWKSQPLHVSGPPSAIASGIAYLTNDRKSTGLVLSMSVSDNMNMARPLRGWRRASDEEAMAESMGEKLHLRAAGVKMEVGYLSGGNQQKVVLGKWLGAVPKVLLLDEPTRGVDVGAKQEIYRMLQEWAENGLAILLISTEMPELLALSDRIMVMHQGHIRCTLERSEASPEKVLAAAMGESA